MFQTILRKIIGSRNDRLVRQYARQVRAINALEPQMEKLSDTELAAKTVEFRTRVEERLAKIVDGPEDDAEARARREEERAQARKDALEELLPEAFAVVREASRRTLNMRHFDVQMIGGIALHNGKIAEMRTGEGKTLVATLPAYLNALGGRGVHVVTVNDYLARRDAEWMGRIHRFLGMSVGVVVPQMDSAEKQRSYQADITYGTNNEYGFDYLRDNMATQVAERFQRGLNYAIV